ncbi:unnamed protein product [Sphagnum balticum]
MLVITNEFVLIGDGWLNVFEEGGEEILNKVVSMKVGDVTIVPQCLQFSQNLIQIDIVPEDAKMHLLRHYLVILSYLLSFKRLSDVAAVAVGVGGMLELESLVDDVVIGEEEKLEHLLVVFEQLGAQICLGICLKLFSFSHA